MYCFGRNETTSASSRQPAKTRASVPEGLKRIAFMLWHAAAFVLNLAEQTSRVRPGTHKAVVTAQLAVAAGKVSKLVPSPPALS